MRRLGPGDGEVLRRLVAVSEALDIATPQRDGAAPLGDAEAAAYLADPSVLHWVAEDGGQLVGSLVCNVLRRRAGDPREVLLFEIGVHERVRRRGVGCALVDALHAWCAAEHVPVVWVLADDDGAVAFYRACGYAPEDGQADLLVRDARR